MRNRFVSADVLIFMSSFTNMRYRFSTCYVCGQRRRRKMTGPFRNTKEVLKVSVLWA